MLEILNLGFSARFRLKFILVIAFLEFVPPSLKGKGDRGKGSIPRNVHLFYYRFSGFCSPVPERERGQGEGFDSAQIAKIRIKGFPEIPLAFPAKSCYSDRRYSREKYRIQRGCQKYEIVKRGDALL